MSKLSLKDSIRKKMEYKCPICSLKFSPLEGLCDHIVEKHKEEVPENVTIKQFIFNKKYNKTKGQCVVDKKETQWNEEKNHYERYCSESCKHIAREQFKANCKRTLGTDNPASTPEHQINAIKGRSYSGEYQFADGGKVGYSSSYEMDFLEFLEKEMGFKSLEIEQCEITFNIIMYNTPKFHIPDYYLPSYNLIVNIKESNNNNTNVAIEGHLRQRLADAAIIQNGNYNYIKIVDKEYTNFVNLITLIDKRRTSTDASSSNVIISIPM